MMFMPLWPDLRDKYVIACIDEEDTDGDPVCVGIKEDVPITAFRIIKNRRGGGKDQIYAVQSNLDLNRWGYIGELVNASKARSTWGYPMVS